MNSLVEAKVGDFLRNWLHYDPYDCGALLEQMRSLARVRGFQFDERFARAGLGGGPEAAIAAAIVDRSLGGGGCEVSDYEMRKHLDAWQRSMPPKGRI
ncbi:MAG: hypothetical protein GXY55_05920 [Phycisphaerae bacterium]|nr:hypothetical protein [Phycisphaerae bacterium]